MADSEFESKRSPGAVAGTIAKYLNGEVEISRQESRGAKQELQSFSWKMLAAPADAQGLILRALSRICNADVRRPYLADYLTPDSKLLPKFFLDL